MAVAVLEKQWPSTMAIVSTTVVPMEDLGNESLERESTLSLLESKEDILKQIEVALQRIEDGVYGECEHCGGRIPQARLNAIPYTIHCVKCDSQIELA